MFASICLDNDREVSMVVLQEGAVSLGVKCFSQYNAVLVLSYQ